MQQGARVEELLSIRREDVFNFETGKMRPMLYLSRVSRVAFVFVFSVVCRVDNLLFRSVQDERFG